MRRWVLSLIAGMLLLADAGLAPVRTAAEPLFDRAAATRHFERGLELYAGRNYAGAAEAFQEANRLDPEYAAPLYFLGYAYYKLRELDRARAVFEQAYQIDRHFSPVPPGGAIAPEPPVTLTEPAAAEPPVTLAEPPAAPTEPPMAPTEPDAEPTAPNVDRN